MDFANFDGFSGISRGGLSFFTRGASGDSVVMVVARCDGEHPCRNKHTMVRTIIIYFISYVSCYV